LEDLPAGFEAVDTSLIGLDPSRLEPHGIPVEQTFAFMHPLRFQFVLGFLSSLPSTTNRFVFDSLAASPDVVGETLVGPAGPLQLEEVQPLEFPEVGDSSGAVSGKLRTGGVRFHTELVMFREGSVGAVLVIARLDGDQPLVGLVDLASTLLGRIRAAS
jgi:hypothetical protein